jgi:mono/diheme cytochrome c family protein
MLPPKFLTAALTLSIACVCPGAVSQDGRSIGNCPQPRFTGKAPAEYFERSNPLAATLQRMSAGRQLYIGTDENGSCTICHGRDGAGNGPLARQYDPPPRNFACAKTVNNVPDGQLFWIIRFGSPDTAMPPHPTFSDEQIWQLVLHLRQLAK